MSNKSYEKPNKTRVNITDEAAIHISNMNKWFGNFHVLRDINLEVRRNNCCMWPIWIWKINFD